MRTRALALKLASTRPTLATATGPVFRMLDPPGVKDAHGDTMDAGALRLPPAGENGLCEVPLYWVHSYHEDVVADASPSERIAIGVAVVWMEEGEPLFTPRFFGNTELSDEVKRRLDAGEIDACSIGYLTEDATPTETGEDVHQARLIEVSLVDKGAKESAVRIKAMTDNDWKKLHEKLNALADKIAQSTAPKTKSFGVEMMCGSEELYFCTEMMEHLAECVAGCQSFLLQDGREPALAALAQALTTSAGKVLQDLAMWLSSGAARGEAAEPATVPAPAESATKAEPEPSATVGDPTTKWWARFSGAGKA